MPAPDRAIIVGNFSGCAGDGPNALSRIVREGPVDVVTADYLAEVNIAWLALEMRRDPSKGYEASFLRQLDKDTAHIIAEKRIKVIHNGGALNPKGLADAVAEQLRSYGITNLKVAFVEGDNVKGLMGSIKAPGRIAHLDIAGRDLSHVEAEILNANAYLGMSAIVAALDKGADIIISGRCCDASPVMGAASWWHGWDATDYDRLSGALIAGHCIECGCYATGGNFSGFKSIPKNWNQGFPIAEISKDGSFDIFLQEGARGLVSTDTITAQLVYEIQGPFYLNPDVVADIREVKIVANGKNRVTVSGLRGSAPPPTTKLAVCIDGGFQFENFYFATGLDIKEKLADFRASLEDETIIPNLADYRVLRVDQYGSPLENGPSQALSTCIFRLFAQADKAETFHSLVKALAGYGLGGYCGLHCCLDPRLFSPRPFVSYEPFLIPYSDLKIKINLDGQETAVSVPARTEPFEGQISYDSSTAHNPDAFGPTMQAPLGARVHARSGDKGSNANVGLWVLEDDEYEWLRAFFSIGRLKTLLGDDYQEGYTIERFELPHLRCVHFLVKGVLEGGVSSSYKLDSLAKSFGEYIRWKHADIPKKFLERGWI